MASRPFSRRPVSSARIRFCLLDDSLDEIYSDRCRRHARTADAAENDDVFYARNDALGYVGRAGGFVDILVFRQYRQFCSANDYQSNQ